jgi:hypothetical protein
LEPPKAAGSIKVHFKRCHANFDTWVQPAACRWPVPDTDEEESDGGDSAPKSKGGAGGAKSQGKGGASALKGKGGSGGAKSNGRKRRELSSEEDSGEEI